MSIRREERLVIAVGAVAGFRLAPGVTVKNGEGNVQIQFDGHASVVGVRESLTWTDEQGERWDLYVENTCRRGLFGIDECMSIIRAGSTRQINSAMRAAVLLASRRRDSMLGEFPDGRYLRG